MLSRSINTGIALILAAFLVASAMGIPHFGMDMAMGSDGQMTESNCFMPGMTEALCQMNPLEHIAAWQSMFIATPNQVSALTLLFALLVLVFGALVLYSHRSASPPRTTVSQPSFLYYKRRISILNPLQEAFSNGILHPKVF